MLDSRNSPDSIVIVGGGSAGWMAANLFIHSWPRTKITLIESQDIGTIGVGEGSTPYLKSFFNQLGIKDCEWMPKCNATYKAGIRFPSWSQIDGYTSYFHPFYSQLDLNTGDEFFKRCLQKKTGEANSVHPDDYFVAEKIAAYGKAPIENKKLPFDVDYGYHFDAGLLGAYLKKLAISKGLKHLVGNVNEVVIGEEGGIKQLNTSVGTLIADVYVDCTGFAGLLINKALKVEFKSYSGSLLNDSAVTVATDMSDRELIPAETCSTALHNGWIWRIPLVNRYGNGYVYSSSFVSSDDAEVEMLRHLKLDKVNHPECKHIKMKVGRNASHWEKNCIAVGLSQGFIEPLEATALMLTQFTIEKFIENYSSEEIEVNVRRENFNSKVNMLIEGVRDYVQAHYLLNSRSDTEYWKACREDAKISSRLESIVAAWDVGELDLALESLTGKLAYLRPSWYVMLSGMGRFSLLDQKNDSRDVSREKAANYCRQIAQTVFQDHRTLLSRYSNNAK
ncbi:Flavin-dependent tryptophan halogenase RebH [Thalassocella blandensis]|nr:Flavin-dependent tryptophan halogenase RebH [Thalassocella blandensis]